MRTSTVVLKEDFLKKTNHVRKSLIHSSLQTSLSVLKAEIERQMSKVKGPWEIGREKKKDN